MANSGIELIAEERQRQIEKENYTDLHDDEHSYGELAIAAACYAVTGLQSGTVTLPPILVINAHTGEDAWPWDKKYDKRRKHGRVKQLTIAGALIAAEIDRLHREGVE